MYQCHQAHPGDPPEAQERHGTAKLCTTPPATQHPGREVQGGISSWKNLLEVRRADGKALFICNCGGKTNKAKNLPGSLAF